MGDSSSGSDIEEFSGIEQPPLLQQLKTILDEYRNDVQIIKELVQNADDAEATSMNILYVGKSLNPEFTNEKTYRRFMRAPALVFQNDALFTDDDWRGIRSIYSSVKKDDPLKIGRFGLGFKSVFHMTDYPCIISGKYALFINPHETRSGRVCVTVKLKNLREWKRLDFQDFMTSMDGTFGFSEKSVDDGHYEGTLFWFPLRQIPSELSDDVYKKADVHGLLQAFISESHRSLIFLKTVCSVDMFVDLDDESDERNFGDNYDRDDDTSLDSLNFGKEIPFYRVCVDNSTNDLAQKRIEMLNELKSLEDKIPEESKHWVHDVVVETKSERKDGEVKISKARWLIVNYLKGGELSVRIQVLKKDKDLLYPHLVALAAPVDEDSNYCGTAGHVFCYQPLPQESSSVTGLPVHVNAFFALTQNRRHIRWPDEDSQHLVTSDKKIEWNCLLQSEILPHAYCQLIKNLIVLSNQEQNQKYVIGAVYNAVPDVEKIDQHWKQLAIDVLSLCKNLNISLFCSERCRNWLPIDDIIVADGRPFDKLSTSCFKTTVDILVNISSKVCILPDHVTDAFKEVWPYMKTVTPLLMRKKLAMHDSYKALTFDEKQDLIEFVLQDPSADLLDSLELVPRADGTFCRFVCQDPVFAESREVTTTFRLHKERLLSPDLRPSICQNLHNLKNKGHLCICSLKAREAKNMFHEVIISQFGSEAKIKGTDADTWKSWIKQVWFVIQRRFKSDRDVFIDLAVFPVLEYTIWETTDECCLLPLQSHFFHCQHSLSEGSLETNVRKAFQLLSVNIVRYIPEWIEHAFVEPFMHDDTSDGLLDMLSRVSEEDIENFNANVTCEIGSFFLEYLSERIHSNIGSLCKTRLRGLKIFKAYIDSTDFQLCCLHDNNRICSAKFPVKFPKRVVVLDSDFEKRFAEKLGAEHLPQDTLAVEALRIFDTYSTEEQKLLTNWAIKHDTVFKNSCVQGLLRSIPFLQTENGDFQKPSELFDPTDHVLKMLFSGQNLFPHMYEDDTAYLKALRILGLKTRSSLTSDDIEKQCDLVHQMSLSSVEFSDTKCKVLLEVMNEMSHLIKRETISTKRCILACEMGDRNRATACMLKYPTEVRSSELSSLIGSVYSTITVQGLTCLSEVFGWSEQPAVVDVVKHLFNVVQNYDLKHKAKTLQTVSEIYEWLSQQNQVSGSHLQSILQKTFSSTKERYVWTGNGFHSPREVYVERREEDIELTPLLYDLPSEMKDFSDFFVRAGCLSNLGPDVYISTLQSIKHICENEPDNNVCSDERLLKLVVEILNKLKESYLDEVEASEREIYFPIRYATTPSGRLRMAPAKQCTYCDTEWLNDMIDDDIIEIHPRVPNETAAALGVLSLRQLLLSHAEAFEEWGQEEPLTRRLRTILKEGYVDGFSVAKELFQNADDAGAKKFWILYDERENNDAKTHLLNENMEKCQGPAIWVFNDEKFTTEDLKNITKLSGATKEDDSTKIGKFGLGFCAVYNLTDVPSFISGQDLVIFDPHTTFLGKALPGKRPGLRINFGLMKNVKMLTRMRNQFKPFEGIFGCRLLDSSPSFEGTLIRLPLRNAESDISGTVYTPSEVKTLVNTIIDRSCNMLLFNQNIEEIKVFHLSKCQSNPLEMNMLFEAKKSVLDLLPQLSLMRTQSVVTEATKMKKRKQYNPPLSILQKNTITGTKYLDEKLLIRKPVTFSSTWLISWATGINNETLKITDSEKGALCLGSVAVPVEYEQMSQSSCKLEIAKLCNLGPQFFSTGHVFFFLPLPIQHNFPFHLNAQFGVTTDRRHLKSSTEDKNVKMKDWNQLMLSDPVVLALLFLLENVNHVGQMQSYQFDLLWPKADSDTGQLLKCLPDSFYREVVRPSIHKVFEKNGEWFDISECVFLERGFRKLNIGETAFASLSRITKHVIDISEEIYKLLLDADSKLIQELTVGEETFFVKYFLPNLEMFFDSTELQTNRDALLSHAVCLGNSRIDKWLKENKCVPSNLSGILKIPEELIDPHSRIAELFDDGDDVFPAGVFQKHAVLDRLRSLGLVHTNLSDTRVVERAKSVEVLRGHCELCAAHRSSLLIDYLSLNERQHEKSFQELIQIPFIPVMSKPYRWPFTWKGEIQCQVDRSKICKKHHKEFGKIHVSRFECAANVYNSDCKYLVGCEQFVFSDRLSLDTKVCSVLKCIGMRGIPKTSVSHQLVIEQLDDIISKTFRKSMKPEFETALKEIYSHLNNQCRDKETMESIKMNLKDKRCVWIDGKFVTAGVVAKNGPVNCQPYLYNVQQTSLKEYNHLCNCIGIFDNFEPRLICRVIATIKETKGEVALTSDEVRTVLNLLSSLENSLKVHNLSFVDQIFDDQIMCVFGPDESGLLRNCKTMCFNDGYNMEKTETMIYAHSDIAVGLASVLGIKPKAIYNLAETSEDIVDFYQEEPLVARLKRLVEGYPSVSGTFKELIQNADDAGATEIHFLLDDGSHRCDNIMNPEFAPLQGPALCVYNSGCFSNTDLVGIQKLGVGSKGEDSSKTGRYGVGFNSVYNITDAPSFYTKGGDIDNGETLCFFDPMAKYLPDVRKSRPGKRYKDLSVIRRWHSNVLDGYHIDYFAKHTEGRGTIFRFPLRTEEIAKNSEIKEEPVDSRMMLQHLEDLKKEAKELLIFLKHLQTIRISQTLQTNRPYECFRVNVDMKHADKLKRCNLIQAQAELCARAAQDREEIFKFHQQSFVYEMTVTEKHPVCDRKSSYTVVQTLGFQNQDVHDFLKQNILKGNLGFVPHGGVALPRTVLAGEPVANHCKAFCFLPLPLLTGLPVHVHGYFALDHEVRRNLFKDEDSVKCYKSLWNSTLLEKVISPAYVMLLELVKMDLFRDISGKTVPLRSITPLLTTFQHLFPNIKTVTDEYWKELSKSVYRQLVAEHVSFLPVMDTRLNEHKIPETTLSWTPLKQKDCEFPAFCKDDSEFDLTVKEMSQLDTISKAFNFSRVLRNIGMRIVTCEENIKASLECSGTAIEDLKPAHVTKYLTSYSSKKIGKCLLEVNKQVSDTVLGSSENVLQVLNFCLDDLNCFAANIQQVPLFLTQDCMLRHLPDRSYFFVQNTGNFCDLFSTKASVFLHSTVCRLLSIKMKDYERRSDGKLKCFSLDKFVELANETGIVKTKTHKSEFWDTQNPTRGWIAQFWRFFYEQLPEKKKPEAVSRNLQVINTVAIIPAYDGHLDFFLVPPVQKETLLYHNSFLHSQKLYEAIRKFRLPDLDTCAMETDVLSLLAVQIPRFEFATKVVENFSLHIDTLKKTELPDTDARCIVRYLNDSLKTQQFSFELKQHLRKLPLFLSRFGLVVALDLFTNACVVPNSIPENGMEDIAKKAGVLLLQTIGCEELYRMLDVQTFETVEVYTKFIVPNHDQMEKGDFYAHVKYIANDRSLSEEESLTKLLKKKQFVRTKDGMVYVKDLFHPFRLIFKEMCRPEELVPDELRDNRILKLFNKLGLVSSMNMKLFERFGEDLQERARVCGLCSDVQKKSTLLLRTLFSMNDQFFKAESFAKLCELKIALPYLVGDQMNAVHRAFNEQQLISFKNSVMGIRVNTCWTVLNVLSLESSPASDVLQKQLQIKGKPDICDLVKHLKNIGESIKEKEKFPNVINHEMVQEIMADVYLVLDDYRRGDELKEEHLAVLRKLLTIYVPSIKQFLPAQHVAIECKVEEEIPPFLNTCPEKYVQYKELFLLLGARKELSCDAYACVLDSLKSQCDEAGKLLPKSKADGRKAMGYFFNFLTQPSTDFCFKSARLYLVSNDFLIKKAEDLVAANDSVLYRTILENYRGGKLWFLLEPKSLETYRSNKECFIDSLSKLPEPCRPRLLTDIVRPRIVLTDIHWKTSEPADDMERFIHSKAFISGVIRIVRHALKEGGEMFSADQETQIATHLSNIAFKHASGIKTVLALKEDRTTGAEEVIIANSHEIKNVHLEVKGDSICIYFDNEYNKWLEDVQTELSIHISEFVYKCLKGKMLMTLREIIGTVERPSQIEVILSKAKIPEYDTEIAIEETPMYPVPGTFVPTELHCFLDNDYGVFYHYDYKFVALEIDDPAVDIKYDEDASLNLSPEAGDSSDQELSATYIFVHIIEKYERENVLPLLQEYKIDDGSGVPRVVKAYQLFKFIAKGKEKVNSELQLVCYKESPSGNSPRPTQHTKTLKEAFAEVRSYLLEAWKHEEKVRKKIVNRLLFKWHPDKNPDNVHFCTEVFKFIQQCILRLEKGLDPPEVPTDESNSTAKDSEYASSSGGWNSSGYGRSWQRYHHTHRHNFDRSRTDWGGSFRSNDFWWFGRSSCSGGRSRRRWSSRDTWSNPEPYHFYSEGRRWQKQAKSDLANSRASLQNSRAHTCDWICFQACQAAEKSLKAAWYCKDANRMNSFRQSHDIVSIASGLGSELADLARGIFSLVDDSSRMLYPDKLCGQLIPAEAYTRQAAETVVDLAQEIVDRVQRDFIR